MNSKFCSYRTLDSFQTKELDLHFGSVLCYSAILSKKQREEACASSLVSVVYSSCLGSNRTKFKAGIVNPLRPSSVVNLKAPPKEFQKSSLSFLETTLYTLKSTILMFITPCLVQIAPCNLYVYLKTRLVVDLHRNLSREECTKRAGEITLL